VRVGGIGDRQILGATPDDAWPFSEPTD